eukprot:CAMPEP_0174907946 /NCGR_PEP_ID=MMETSP0167-20121228/62741_1 /TAXON_ID=38298 /ORGANISM="Rhodella maculata, Strain CCMP736" /LENGTH=424 /DNA_ID=CAMNT_0016151543 /DNA_START=353 /DNA_END=1624 /DNA_ORIENTATION=+
MIFRPTNSPFSRAAGPSTRHNPKTTRQYGPAPAASQQRDPRLGEGVRDPLWVLLVRELLEHEVLDELREATIEDGLPRALHEVDEVVDVVQREELPADGAFTRRLHVNVGARVVFADVALAFFIDRPKILGHLRVSHLEEPRVDDGGAEPRGARGIHAIKHIDTQRDADNEIHRISHAHAIPRLILGELVGTDVHDAPKHVLFLATGEAADGVTGEVAADEFADAVFAELDVEAALDDAEEVLGGFAGVGGVAAVDPAEGAVHGGLDAGAGGGGGNDVVEGHDDVGADLVLDLDGFFRGEEDFGAVDDGLEADAFLGHLGEINQGHHLEAARVGEHGAVPLHEVVNAAELLQHVAARPQREVVRVREADLGVRVAELRGVQPLHGRLGADGHEDGGDRGVVREVDCRGPRLARARVDLEAQRGA